MNLTFLKFLVKPAFFWGWYGFGVLAAIWIIYDSLTANRHMMPALKLAWPLIMVFFSIVGFALYILSCRPPHIGHLSGTEAKQVHHKFVDVTWKKVIGSLIHCVGGDGLGIVSAMVVTRWLGFSFWEEFWTEYAVGFAFGWLIFQYLAMRKMGNPAWRALWKGGRAEFFSMISVMIGMGLVMRFVTPAIIGVPPKPNSYAFWGFAAFGLFVGAVFTYPMNWWLVRIGWKHGMN
jgi:hypothetical protein